MLAAGQYRFPDHPDSNEPPHILPAPPGQGQAKLGPWGHEQITHPLFFSGWRLVIKKQNMG